MDHLTESRFNMWRAVFAVAHADGIVTPHEVSFLQDQVKSLTLSEKQFSTLQNDLSVPQDVTALYLKIESPEDRADFFMFARYLCWSDGDFHTQEQKIMETLRALDITEHDRKLLSESQSVVREVDFDQAPLEENDRGFLGLFKTVLARAS